MKLFLYIFLSGVIGCGLTGCCGCGEPFFAKGFCGCTEIFSLLCDIESYVEKTDLDKETRRMLEGEWQCVNQKIGEENVKEKPSLFFYPDGLWFVTNAEKIDFFPKYPNIRMESFLWGNRWHVRRYGERWGSGSIRITLEAEEHPMYAGSCVSKNISVSFWLCVRGNQITLTTTGNEITPETVENDNRMSILTRTVSYFFQKK
jgi:hypothetical protein